MNQKFSDVQAEFRKGRGTRDQIANLHWILEKARECQKNIHCSVDYAKAFDYLNHNKLWETLKEMRIPDHLSYLLRNLYVSQEAVVRTLNGQLTGSKLRKEQYKAAYSHPAYLTYILSTSNDARLDELQAGIKIAGRNINNLRYVDDTTLTAKKQRGIKASLDESVRVE